MCVFVSWLSWVVVTCLLWRRQVAVHRHGCCVLQRCLDAAGPDLRMKLVDEVRRVVFVVVIL